MGKWLQLSILNMPYFHSHRFWSF